MADALSRITIDELKDLYGDVPVLVITRSMTKSSTNKTIPGVDTMPYEMNVYEDFDNGFSKAIPRIKTNSVIFNKSKSKIISVTVSVYQAHCRLFHIKLENDISIKQILLKMQNAAKMNGTKNLQISTQDAILKMCTLNDFKTLGNNELKINYDCYRKATANSAVPRSAVC